MSPRSGRRGVDRRFENVFCDSWAASRKPWAEGLPGKIPRSPIIIPGETGLNRLWPNSTKKRRKTPLRTGFPSPPRRSGRKTIGQPDRHNCNSINRTRRAPLIERVPPIRELLDTRIPVSKPSGCVPRDPVDPVGTLFDNRFASLTPRHAQPGTEDGCTHRVFVVGWVEARRPTRNPWPEQEYKSPHAKALRRKERGKRGVAISLP